MQDRCPARTEGTRRESVAIRKGPPALPGLAPGNLGGNGETICLLWDGEKSQVKHLSELQRPLGIRAILLIWLYAR